MSRPDRRGEPTIVTLADPDACALAAAERIVEILDVAIDDHGEAHWATTGGSTPAGIYRHLVEAPLRSEIDWRRVHLWWTDERFVPADHPLSNQKIANDILLAMAHRSGLSGSGGLPADAGSRGAGGLPIRTDQVHPIEAGSAIGAGHDQGWAAARYADELHADGPDPDDDGWPAFDLMLLGVGSDGHILSVFPGSPAFDAAAWAVGVPAPTHIEPHVSRITLNPGLAVAAHELLVVSHGEGKAEILRDILRGERDERRLPAQLARRPGATWMIDRAAARLL
ncbi:MAG TPA: 6-phosphogluconolactonase [Candidatus Limnocylindrales bacterium]|nr:6-phosphogluconolactonase [Candidatus Limnocylindrales bacterium]